MHLVNPQCLPVGTTPQQFLTSTASLLGGGPVTYPTDNSPLFANLTPLISNTQVHFLGYAPLRQNYTTTEWIDHFVSFTVSGGFVYDTPNPPDDRQINKNALYPVTDVLTGLKIQKGVRITECIDASSTSPVGSAGWGTPNGPDNALIYTQRIVNYVNSLIGSSTQLTFSTFVNGAWSTPSTTNANALITKTIEFYLGMEIGHAVELTPTVEGIRTTSYGYHHAPGTGSNMDQTVTNKLSTKSGSGNTFYIPSLYNSGDQSNFKLND